MFAEFVLCCEVHPYVAYSGCNIPEMDYPSGRTWASLFSASDNSSKYKYGHEDELSLQTNYLRFASVKTYNLRFFF